MGSEHSHHQQSPSHDKKCVDPSHSHNKQPETKQKILKDPIILPQYGGQITIDHANKMIVRKILIMDFQQQFVEYVVRNRMLLRHPNLITVKKYVFQSLNDNEQFDSRTDLQKSLYFCYPHSQILRLEFDPAIFHVHAMILQYCQKRQPMQESEIRRIMSSVMDCLIYLKHNGTFHGDIKPSTIFIHPKTQVVQLVDSYFANNGRTGYEIVNQNPGCKSFLTPQQLQRKKKKATDSLEYIYQSEVFCIGLTLIEMMTFQQSMQIYQLEQLSIRRQFIEQKAIEMHQYGYSKQLADLALSCIHKDPLKRPIHQQIREILQGKRPQFVC